jgi:hypothetical protein
MGARRVGIRKKRLMIGGELRDNKGCPLPAPASPAYRQAGVPTEGGAGSFVEWRWRYLPLLTKGDEGGLDDFLLKR